MQQTKLFNGNFIFASLANLMLFIGFHLVMPIIAQYVIEVFKQDAAVAGLVTSVYIITALLTRPLSGFMVDNFDRKWFYVIVYFIFTLLFFGYVFAASILSLIVVRVCFGFVFSCITTASSTIAIDVMPSERRAEGIGYFGATGVMAMAIGPMVGLYLLGSFTYTELFYTSILSCTIGFIFACLVKTQKREKVKHQKLSFDRFFLKEGFSISIILSMAYFLFGVCNVYMPQYIKELGLDVSPGSFFLLYALGIMFSRIVGGKFANKGYHHALLMLSISCLFVGCIILLFFLNVYSFYFAALILGLGFGFMSPSIQTMIISLVPASRRGTANSTYFIAMDLGSGLGMLLGGVIASMFNFYTVFLCGLAIIILSFFVYNLYSKKDYELKKFNSVL